MWLGLGDGDENLRGQSLETWHEENLISFFSCVTCVEFWVGDPS